MTSLLSSSLGNQKRRLLVRRLAILSAASGALFSPPARAQTSDRWIPGAGIFIGAAFGSGARFEWGLETFATYRFAGYGCSNTPRSGVGPLLQIAVGDFTHPRATLAIQGGAELSTYSLTALTFEVGATYRLGDRPGFGIHTGITPEFVIFNGSFRAQWLLDDYSITGGARLPATYGGPGYCVEGRPLRTAAGLANVCGTTNHGDALPSHARRDDVALLAGRGWEGAARHECASVPAFLQLAAELLAHDAPDALIARALAAAEDEIRHTQLCAALASRYLGARICPTLPDVPPRPPRAGTAGLVRLATESWLDGCLAEGVAARRAERASQLATDALAQEAQRVIAREEARHADLAWSILSWATERGGAEARDEVRSLRNVEMTPCPTEGDPATARYGRLGASHVNEVTERHHARSRDRLDALL
jgi:hypothetical protein